MIPSYCIDTNILLLLLRGQALGKGINEDYGLSLAPFQHTVSIVTHGELLVLSDRNKWGGSKMRALEKALFEFVTVDISGRKIVDAYREIERASSAVSRGAVTMGKNDLWIAATAMVVGQPLLTTDRDFVHLNGALLQVLWIDPKVAE